MTVDRSLHIPVGPGLAFRFDLPEKLLRRVERFLDYFPDSEASPSDEPVPVTSEPPAGETPVGGVLLEEPSLVVRRAGEVILFELPRIRAWCDGARGRAGVVLHRPSDAELDLFIGLALAPMLIELAPSRGWLGVHAAAVSIDGAGILLPGPSGAGKSTIFSHVHQSGHGVLSDDLVWLRPATGEAMGGTTMYAFPRGAGVGSVPAPTADGIGLRAIVCPVIAGGPDNRLLPMAFPQALEILVDQGGFLSSGATAGDRFRALVRVARSVPAYRLEAGEPRREVPALLAELAASSSLRSASRTRPAGNPR